MAGQELRVRLVADAGGFRAVVDGAARDLTVLGRAGASAGQSASSGFNSITASAKSTNLAIGQGTREIAALIASSRIGNLAGDFLNLGRVVDAVFAGRLAHAVGQYAAEAKNAVSATLGQRQAALAAAAAATAHHRELSATYAATIASGSASAAYTAHLRAQLATSIQVATAARAQAASVGLAGRAFALLGGPVGLISVAATALAFWASTTGTAAAKTDTANESIKGLSDTIEKFSVQSAARRIVFLNEQLANIGDRNKAVSDGIRRQIAEQEKLISGQFSAESKIQSVLDRFQPDRKKNVTSSGTGSSAEAFGKSQADLARLAYPEATQTAEEYGEAQAKVAQKFLESQESAEQYGQRLADIARLAYPAATETAEEYGEVQAKVAQKFLESQESAEQYGQRLADLARLAYPEATESAEEFGERMAEQSKKFLEDNKTFAQEYSDVWGNAAAGFSSNIGRSVADAILEQKKFSDLLKTSVRSMAREVIGAFISIAARRAVDFALGEFFKTASTVSSVAAGTATALAWAPAAAAVSLATAGANSVPAAAGVSSTFALSTGLALSGIAHDGLDYVPNTGTFLLERGERVVKKEDNKRLENFLNGAGAGSINISFNVTGADAPRAADIVRSQRGQIISIIQSAYDERGRRGGPVS